MCAHKELSLVFDLFKAYFSIESKSFFFSSEKTFFHSFATCSELPSNISTMVDAVLRIKFDHFSFGLNSNYTLFHREKAKKKYE